MNQAHDDEEMEMEELVKYSAPTATKPVSADAKSPHPLDVPVQTLPAAAPLECSLRTPERSVGYPMYLPHRVLDQRDPADGSGYWKRPLCVEWQDLGSLVKIEIHLPVLFKNNFRLSIMGKSFDFV